MKNSVFIIPIIMIFLCSCYKTGSAQKDNSIPKFDISASSESSSGDIIDSITTFTFYDSTTPFIDLRFSLISGNPENYPITVFINNLPPGITFSPDSSVLQLSSSKRLDFTVNGDTGTYVVNFNVDCPGMPLKIYPVRFRIISL